MLGLRLGRLGRDARVIGLLATCLPGGLVALGIMIVRRSRRGEYSLGPWTLSGALFAAPVLPSG
ncbi:hypothetical protein BJY14_003078 [Actinomadura luteofluorescens]|uniref:Uncharacterized protein n=1 Tax=Actinomadura luteofluorescens TaxID=46163 RepID=A0A7Y9JFM3_9ACTN|nr:hypothetical protein [Actinomadura luteofluorescens]NYD47095.1 hypothetical protein [Actinomadura luteofluorescens]